jgi:hypothetical protein
MNPIHNKILVIVIAIILTGTALFAYSAVTHPQADTPYDLIIGTIGGVDFQINKLAFGGSSQQETLPRGVVYNPDSRFVFSHVIAEIDHVFYDTSFSELLVTNILRAQNLYFDLDIKVYKSCTVTYDDCKVTSELNFPQAFIAGYHFILNQPDKSLPDYDFVEIFEFGFNQFNIQTPNTIEDAPDVYHSGSVSSTSTTSGHGSLEDQYALFYDLDWKVVFNFDPIVEIKVYAIQFSITAEIHESLTGRDGDSDNQISPSRYIISDVYFEKDVLDNDTVLLVDILNTGGPFDAFVDLSFCDAQGTCNLETEMQLDSSKITSLFSYLEDTTYDDKIVSTEIFSLAADHLNINYNT